MCADKNMSYEDKKSVTGCKVAQKPMPRIICSICDYSLPKGDFDSGKGRIMNIKEGEYLCGFCDKEYASTRDLYEGTGECMCKICGYYLTQEEFEYGKGRFMFCSGPHIEEGEFVCGVCDERCDSDGEYLGDESDVE